MNDPSVSVSVGLTVSPKPYESIRVDLEYQNVLLDGSNLEQVLDSSGPIVERLFATALFRAEKEIERVKENRYGDPTPAFAPESPGDVPPSRPANRQWSNRGADDGLALG